MSDEAESGEVLHQVAETDWFLQSLVKMVNGFTIEFGITLQVSGMLVSGNLVSGEKYFEGFAADFSGPFNAEPEVAESIRKNFSSYGEIYRVDNDEATRPLPQFIHLKNARFFNTADKPIPGNTGVWWRGRISEVGGFSLGSLRAEEA
jgi:hypothetical protein